MKIRSYTVLPSLPSRLQPLSRISYNTWWSWSRDAIELFRRIDPDLWEEVNHSPVEMLGRVDQKRLEELIKDRSFLAFMDRVESDMNDYLYQQSWFDGTYPDRRRDSIAYFSAEFGIHESVPIYSGGLGILAGDHMKSASDLGLPLVGVGLLYRQGYFRQYLNADGWQQETYPQNDFANMPVKLELDKSGNPIKISVDLPGRQVFAQIWRCQVGRVPLYFMDADIPENNAADRMITHQLYGGDWEMRIKQEILLGIGGVRLLHMLRIRPTVYHINEGHSAFLALERIRLLMENRGLNMHESREIVKSSTCFTTHTPVPAGNDVFSLDLMDKYFGDFYKIIGFTRDEFLGLGRQDPFDKTEQFCMTVLALRLTSWSNAVSELHGDVARKMWNKIWKELTIDEVPIKHITNGIHTPSWVSQDMAQLYNRYLGPDWKRMPHDKRSWERVPSIPDAELWRTHERRRERLVAFARRRLKVQLQKRGAMKSDVQAAAEVLDPEALTIGFARRFATYKRGTLIARDPERLSRMLNNKEKPVQIILAGKAHPKDTHGKEFIKRMVQLAAKPEFRHRIVFIEDYDINVAQYIVAGVDVWLNNPRRPLEASGTSGMKVAANGGLNLSIMDGWWCEGFNGNNGWAIGHGEEYDDLEYQDEIESEALYNVLEKEIVPLFYNSSSDGLPREWIQYMKNSIQSVGQQFSATRMAMDYLHRFYMPHSDYSKVLKANNYEQAKVLAAWKDSIIQRWNNVGIESVSDSSGELRVGELMQIEAIVKLAGIKPEEVIVEVYHGGLDLAGDIKQRRLVQMGLVEVMGDGRYRYKVGIPCAYSGRHGYAVRMRPMHERMSQMFEPGWVIWS